MKIKLTSIMVDDQAKALAFYTNVLGFVPRRDIPMGEYRWLTVVSPEGADDLELVLEPTGFPPAQVFQKALFDAGIPQTAFQVTDLQAEYDRLKAAGVVIRMEPWTMEGGPTLAMFEDSCGNLIQLYQP